ncbi:MerR HTH family regulatory protein [Pseudoxanthobacter soli DSM 19599]|mgnify:CR=1 FL=1|uniref:MerR HTH family regulatory protein n=1 Tax=Pseudoxanthobacter soli DSM 19599 TaxID=1123029 RepID=A0A1M7Z659_9HYPH|nr:MerR family transcriptional regulator [Pseudoxanthobacter soli]SHO60312.1 MerR HTH family regulatory protein [Pseudoxanthobacter soli DSM 19599]
MEKSPEAFRTISEVGTDLDLPQHVLRFWETRFTQIKPLKRAGGRRYYRPEDVDLLRGIRHLLYNEGYTIRGVQRILSGHGVRHVAAIGRGGPEAVAALAAVPREPSDDHDEPSFPFEGGETERPAPSLAVQAARAIDEDGMDENEPLISADDRRTVGGDPGLLGMDVDGPVPRDIRVGSEDEHRGGAFRFFDRLRGGEGKGGDGGLTREDVRRLQSTLFELLECKRLLDQAR